MIRPKPLPKMKALLRGYEGMEIDMLSLGDADCILVSRWVGGDVTRVLIDGGEAKHSGRIKRFLKRRGGVLH